MSIFDDWMIDCPRCGEQTYAWDRFCYKCDARYTDAELPVAPGVLVGSNNPERRLSDSVDARHGSCHACSTHVPSTMVFGVQMTVVGPRGGTFTPLPNWFDSFVIQLNDAIVCDLNLLAAMRTLLSSNGGPRTHFSPGFWADVLLEQLPRDSNGTTSMLHRVFLRPCVNCGDRDPLLLADTSEASDMPSRNVNDDKTAQSRLHTCPRCRQQLNNPTTQRFCAHCGEKLVREDIDATDPSVAAEPEPDDIARLLELVKTRDAARQEALAVEGSVPIGQTRSDGLSNAPTLEELDTFMDKAAEGADSRAGDQLGGRVSSEREAGIEEARDPNISAQLSIPCFTCASEIAVDNAFGYIFERAARYDIFEETPDWMTVDTPRFQFFSGESNGAIEKLTECISRQWMEIGSQWSIRSTLVKPCPDCADIDPWRLGEKFS